MDIRMNRSMKNKRKKKRTIVERYQNKKLLEFVPYIPSVYLFVADNLELPPLQ